MRLILLGAPGSGKRALRQRILAERALPVIEARDLADGAAMEVLDGNESVSYQLPLERLRERLAGTDLSRGYLLDLAPASAAQAAALDALLEGLGAPLDLVLAIEIDPDTLLERMVGRQTCRDCGSAYNSFTDPPRVEGVCDRCGGDLRRSPRGSEQAFHQRCRLYQSRTQPLLGYYGARGLLRKVRGEAEADELYTAVGRLLADLERVPAPAPTAAPAGDPEPAVPQEPTAMAAGGEASPVAAAATGDWKRGAEAKGRVKRHPDGGKGDQGAKKSRP